MQEKRRFLKIFFTILGFTFLEPAFEILFLLAHNFVFYKIAHIETSAISLSLLLNLKMGHVAFNIFDAYKMSLPFSFALGLLLGLQRFYGKADLLQTLLQASLIVLVMTGITVLKTYSLVHWTQTTMILTYILSCFYWYLSASFSWMVLALLRIL